MKRRGFVKSILAAPVLVPAIPLVAQTPAPRTPVSAPVPVRPGQPLNPAQLATVPVDQAAETTQRFFTPEQFAALEKLGDIFVPPLAGKPGASQAGAAVFLDFLVSESPVDQQRLYRRGLEGLNIAAHKHFNKPFADLDAEQAGTILKPLMTVRLWSKDIPEDLMQQFVMQAHDDLRTATMNSREWAQTSSVTPGRRGFNRAAGLYWNPIDPVVKG